MSTDCLLLPACTCPSVLGHTELTRRCHIASVVLFVGFVAGGFARSGRPPATLTLLVGSRSQGAHRTLKSSRHYQGRLCEERFKLFASMIVVSSGLLLASMSLCEPSGGKGNSGLPPGALSKNGVSKSAGWPAILELIGMWLIICASFWVATEAQLAVSSPLSLAGSPLFTCFAIPGASRDGCLHVARRSLCRRSFCKLEACR